jgi:hypothetical protein
VREIPEAAKPRRIAINGVKQVEGQAVPSEPKAA